MDKNEDKLKYLTDYVYKPNQITLIENGELSVIQKKVINVLIQNTHNSYVNEIEEEVGKLTRFSIDIPELMRKSDVAIHHSHVVEEMKKLMNLKLFSQDKHGFKGFVLFPNIEYNEDKDKLIYTVNDVVTDIIKNKYHSQSVNSKYYTVIHLQTNKFGLKKHAYSLYEYCLRFKDLLKNSKTEDYDTFKAILGVEGYDEQKVFMNRALKPAIEDVNEKTDIEVSIEIIRGMRKKIKQFKISAKFNDDFEWEDNRLREERKKKESIDSEVLVKVYDTKYFISRKDMETIIGCEDFYGKEFVYKIVIEEIEKLKTEEDVLNSLKDKVLNRMCKEVHKNIDLY